MYKIISDKEKFINLVEKLIVDNDLGASAKIEILEVQISEIERKIALNLATSSNELEETVDLIKYIKGKCDLLTK